MASEAAVAGHGALKVHLAPHDEFTCKGMRSSIDLLLVRKLDPASRTEICPREGLVRQADLEPSLASVEAGDGEAAAIDSDRVSDVAVRQDLVSVGDDERVAFELGGRVDRLDAAEDLYKVAGGLAVYRAHPEAVGMALRTSTSPVNTARV